MNLKKYYNNKRIRILLFYLQIQYPHILANLLGTQNYSKWIKTYGKNIKWLFDLELYAQNSNDEEIKAITQEIIQNPHEYLSKYLPPEYLVEISAQKILINLDKLLQNMPKGIASEGIAKIIEVITEYYKEKEKEKNDIKGLSISDLIIEKSDKLEDEDEIEEEIEEDEEEKIEEDEIKQLQQQEEEE